MNGKEFKKRVQKYAKSLNLKYEEDTRKGKGSHIIIYLDNRHCTVKYSEIGAGLLNEMCKQLGITKQDL